MPEKNQVIFKTVLMGFEKDAVLNYIDELCTMFHTETEKQTVESENLKQENERLRKQAEQLNSQAAEREELLQKQEDQLRIQADTIRRHEERLGKDESISEISAAKDQEIAQLKARLNALTKDLERSRLLLGQKEDALTYLRTQSEQMINQQKELAEKGKKYDIISTNVGSIVLEAEHTANNIIRAANEEADRTRSEAAAAANAMGEHLNAFRREMERMQGSVVNTFRNLKDNFAAMEETLTDAEKFLFPPREEAEQDSEKQETGESSASPDANS